MQTRRSKLVYYIFALIAIVIVVAQIRSTIVQDEQQNPTPQSIARNKKKAYRVLARSGYTGEIGDAKAPIRVVAMTMTKDKEQMKTIRLLIDYAKQHTKDVHLIVLIKEDNESLQRAMTEGLQPDPGMGQIVVQIVVNGETDFTIKGPSGTGRNVSFKFQPNTERATYRSEDVIAVLEQKVAALQKP